MDHTTPLASLALFPFASPAKSPSQSCAHVPFPTCLLTSRDGGGGFVFSLKVSLIPLTSPEALGYSVQIMWWWRFFVPLWKYRRGCLGRGTIKRWAAEICKIVQIKDLATTGDIHYTHYIIQCGFKAKHKYMCKNSPSLRVQQVSTTLSVHTTQNTLKHSEISRSGLMMF